MAILLFLLKKKNLHHEDDAGNESVFSDLLITFFSLFDEHSEIVGDLFEFSFLWRYHTTATGGAQEICSEHLVDVVRCAGYRPVTTTQPIVMVLENAVNGEVTITIVFTTAFSREYVDFLLTNAKGIAEVGFDHFSCVGSFFGECGELTKELKLGDGQCENFLKKT